MLAATVEPCGTVSQQGTHSLIALSMLQSLFDTLTVYNVPHCNAIGLQIPGVIAKAIYSGLIAPVMVYVGQMPCYVAVAVRFHPALQSPANRNLIRRVKLNAV